MALQAVAVKAKVSVVDVASFLGIGFTSKLKLFAG
jgi:hypothetical protein